MQTIWRPTVMLIEPPKTRRSGIDVTEQWWSQNA